MMNWHIEQTDRHVTTGTRQLWNDQILILLTPFPKHVFSSYEAQRLSGALYCIRCKVSFLMISLPPYEKAQRRGFSASAGALCSYTLFYLPALQI
jgi:hypothetical protein